MYATLTDMQDRFQADELIQLTDEARVGSIDAAKIETALSDAQDEINSYLATRYTVPLAPAPAVVKRYTCDIARYNLYRDAVPEAVRVRYQDAIKWLKLVADGTASLEMGGEEPVAGDNTVQFEIPSREFTRQTLRGF